VSQGLLLPAAFYTLSCYHGVGYPVLLMSPAFSRHSCLCTYYLLSIVNPIEDCGLGLHRFEYGRTPFLAASYIVLNLELHHFELLLTSF